MNIFPFLFESEVSVSWGPSSSMHPHGSRIARNGSSHCWTLDARCRSCGKAMRFTTEVNGVPCNQSSLSSTTCFLYICQAHFVAYPGLERSSQNGVARWINRLNVPYNMYARSDTLWMTF